MVAQTGVGTPYFVTRAVGTYAQNHSEFYFYPFAGRFNFGQGVISNITFEYGNTFTWVAGLLNFLVILDAFDIVMKRKE